MTIIKVGHRGAMGYEPENTLRSFKKALELGVDMIEFDVYVCKSGELVVIHDDTLERTTNGKGLVIEKTLAELKELDAGKEEKIPTLEEIMDLADKKVKINIELKGDNTAKPVLNMIEKYVDEKGWKYDDFLVSSFNHGELKNFKELNPKIKTGILVEEKNPYQLASAIVNLMENKMLQKKLIKNAISRIKNAYSWDKVAEKFAEVYNKIK